MTEIKNISSASNQKTVLIAPLDWGLGHATRCIPIIKELLVCNFKVQIAADGAIADLLKAEFPDVEILTISNYRIRYGTKKSGFFWKILLQLPRISRIIRNEKKWLSRLMEHRKIDIVISDNRPGLHNKGAHCIYLTHQLNVKTGHAISQYVSTQLHRYFIRRFNECWVPDVATDGLSGGLGHSPGTKIPVRYINPISRFSEMAIQKIFDIAIIISGPEPQRTAFENIVMEQISHSSQSIIVVLGLPSNHTVNEQNLNSLVVPHLTAGELNAVLCGSKLVISRSGYTSIMDYVKLKKKAVLIPTPGQPEQEYLASYLDRKRYFLVQDQERFDLKTAWEASQQFEPALPEIDFELFKQSIRALAVKNS